MSAPTPVSALVHSSTLVTAGVYLLYRFAFSGSAFLTNVGILSTLVAGIAAVLECDAKKIIALSTLSQLGLIFTSLGLGERSLCFAHLNTHAAFKALLFLAVGTLIHTCYGTQESRCVTPYLVSSPFIGVVLISSCASMCGWVFLSGWVTKEAILQSILNNCHSLATLILFYFGVMFTLVYCLRLLSSFVLRWAHCPAVAPTLTSTCIIKVPMCWLLFLVVSQGLLFNIVLLSFPRILRSQDVIVL